MVDSEDFCLFD